jgi:hypothetical protein
MRDVQELKSTAPICFVEMKMDAQHRLMITRWGVGCQVEGDHLGAGLP